MPDSPGSCVKSANYGGANNHRDPGVNWEWCQYMEMIGDGANCKCNDAFTHFNCTLDGSEAWKCADGATVERSCTASARAARCSPSESTTPAPRRSRHELRGQHQRQRGDRRLGRDEPRARAGAGGVGGAGGAPRATTGSGGKASKSGGQDSSCAITGAPAEDLPALWSLSLLGIAAIRRRKSA